MEHSYLNLSDEDILGMGHELVSSTAQWLADDLWGWTEKAILERFTTDARNSIPVEVTMAEMRALADRHVSIKQSFTTEGLASIAARCNEAGMGYVESAEVEWKLRRNRVCR